MVGYIKNRITNSNAIDIGIMINEVLEPVEGHERTVSYKEGWSDAKVARILTERLGAEIPQRTVENIRNTRHGTLVVRHKEKATPAQIPGLEPDKLAEVHSQLAKLGERVSATASDVLQRITNVASDHGRLSKQVENLDIAVKNYDPRAVVKQIEDLRADFLREARGLSKRIEALETEREQDKVELGKLRLAVKMNGSVSAPRP